MHFSEIIKLQFGKERLSLLCILELLQILLINYLRKMPGYPKFSFLDFNNIFNKSPKNTFELVGTVLKKLYQAYLFRPV